MGNGDILNEDAPVFVQVPKMMASKRGSEVGDNAAWETKPVYDICMISSKRSTAFFAVAETSGLYSIHLENLSMAMYTYQKPPGAGLKGPIMSSPQHAKGQEAMMVCNSCAGTCIYLAKN